LDDHAQGLILPYICAMGEPCPKVAAAVFRRQRKQERDLNAKTQRKGMYRGYSFSLGRIRQPSRGREKGKRRVPPRDAGQSRREENEKDSVVACRGMGILPMIPRRTGRPRDSPALAGRRYTGQIHPLIRSRTRAARSFTHSVTKYMDSQMR